MSFPEAFIIRIKEQFGKEADLLQVALNNAPSVSVRINKNKWKRTVNLERVPWSENGYYLKKRPVFTRDPLFHAGVYYPQEPASMVIEHICQKLIHKHNFSPRKILDAAAAPGGKTLILSDFFPEALVLANEFVKKRSIILKENIVKWGNENIVVTNNDTAVFSKCKNCFDLVLIDAPCSGEGMFRKDLEARNEWSEQNARMCAVRQNEIIQNLIDTITPGGYLIYSTCTFNPAENEAIVEQLLNSKEFKIIDIDELLTLGVDKVGNFGYRFLPHRLSSEGFFVAVLQKEKNKYHEPNTKKKLKHKKTHQKLPNFPFLINTEQFFVKEIEQVYYKIPKTFNEINIKKLNVIYAGINLGIFKKQKFIPSIDLVLSRNFKDYNIPSLEVDYKNALLYLKGDSQLNFQKSNISKGYYAITYQNNCLGLINHLGNRINNLYPKPWRIKMPLKDFEKQQVIK